MSETEKITINTSVVDLGKIDLLVEEGFYSNRTDFIRTAIRHQLTLHKDPLEKSMVRKAMIMGVLIHTRQGLEKALAKGEKHAIRVVGMYVIVDDVDPELALATIESIKVLGVFRANKAVRQALVDRIQTT